MIDYPSQVHVLSDVEQRSQYDDSLTRKIRGFFQRNPDESLTYDDMSVKWDCTPKQAMNACSTLRKDHGMRLVNVGGVIRLNPGPAA